MIAFNWSCMALRSAGSAGAWVGSFAGVVAGLALAFAEGAFAEGAPGMGRIIGAGVAEDAPLRCVRLE